MRTDLVKLYDALTNPPDVNGSDFAHVASWLIEQNLPSDLQAQIDTQQVGYPGGHYTNQIIVFSRPGLPAQAFSLYLYMNSPGTTLLALEMMYHFGDPSVLREYTPPAVPLPPPTDPPKITNPVGGPEGYLNWYWPVAGDHSPDGATWADERGSFVCVMSRTPFGESRYWKKVA